MRYFKVMSEMPERNAMLCREFTRKRVEREEDTPILGFFSFTLSSTFLNSTNKCRDYIFTKIALVILGRVGGRNGQQGEICLFLTISFMSLMRIKCGEISKKRLK